MASDKAWDDMTKLVNKFIQMPDAEPFRVEVDWKNLGLYDYPQIIKAPMDLGKVKKKLQTKGGFSTLYEVAEDVRLVWSNCMAYNADGSDFYILAQNLAKKFDDRFSKLLADHALAAPSSTVGGASSDVVSLEEKRSFAKSLYKLTKDELGKIVVTLDEKCPAALVKNATEDEVELNVDKISQEVFSEIVSYAKTCQENSLSKKAKNKNKPSTKKARVSSS
eukprot:CAMPEP_0119013260 /NCGR_PEP_ID=MMETSP1176-20130426/8253_1 /TAXON_ID=265551 /ORGANISM="Synedropsis recta cf, Strain CCMP1620" /LENGTH=220 /DNA_ID=CAMNT_0006966341 /DNA_START=92 /DNA_END=754 /DNA_ORIENTATION=-